MGRLIDPRPLSSEGCGLSGAFKFFSEAIMCLQLLKLLSLVVIAYGGLF